MARLRSPDAFLAEARASAGLDDFGEDSFLEGLEVLLRALNAEARLNAAGVAVLSNRIAHYLRQRLQIEDWYKRHPEIDAVEIKAPLIGISLPRTGSTALSFLLAEDPNARSLRRWEAAQPCPPPSTVQGPDPRIAREEALDRPAGATVHVPSSATGPIECQELMALDFKSQFFQAFAQVPSYSQWLMQADLRSTYRYERRVLKLLQWGYPAKPWRLKCPNHLSFLAHLDQAFPDARFVMTHRDPSEVVVSNAHLHADYIARCADHVDPHYIGAFIVEQLSLSMRRALAFRDAGNQARFYDIDFRAMQRDPIGQVRGLYDWLGEPVTPEFEAGMARWWAQSAENREPNVHPDASAFGIDLARVRPLFADYAARVTGWTTRGASHGH
jgi:Sulfotransferase family